MSSFRSERAMRLFSYKEVESHETVFGNAIFIGINKEDAKQEQLIICSTDKQVQRKLKESVGKRCNMRVALYNYDSRVKVKILDVEPVANKEISDVGR